MQWLRCVRGGLENAAKRAVQSSGKAIPCDVVTISTDGKFFKNHPGFAICVCVGSLFSKNLYSVKHILVRRSVLVLQKTR